jgi:cobalt/nickel transport protein
MNNIYFFKWFAVIGLVVLIFSLAFFLNPSADFSGADDKGTKAIKKLNPDYKPWFSPIWEPPPETESMLFALQAAIGGIILGYFLGYLHFSKN